MLHVCFDRTSVSPYTSGCVNVSSLECDFSHLGVPVSEYATYTGRVRTQGGGETSTWVESNQITLDKDSETVFYNVSKPVSEVQRSQASVLKDCRLDVTVY